MNNAPSKGAAKHMQPIERDYSRGTALSDWRGSVLLESLLPMRRSARYLQRGPPEFPLGGGGPRGVGGAGCGGDPPPPFRRP